jgi:hypothetical protein
VRGVLLSAAIATGFLEHALIISASCGAVCAGILAVKRVNGVPVVFPADSGEVKAGENLLVTVYDKGPLPSFAWDSFSTVRTRAATEWEALPKACDNISASLYKKVERELKPKGPIVPKDGQIL